MMGYTKFRRNKINDKISKNLLKKISKNGTYKAFLFWLTNFQKLLYFCQYMSSNIEIQILKKRNMYFT